MTRLEKSVYFEFVYCQDTLVLSLLNKRPTQTQFFLLFEVLGHYKNGKKKNLLCQRHLFFLIFKKGADKESNESKIPVFWDDRI